MSESDIIWRGGRHRCFSSTIYLNMCLGTMNSMVTKLVFAVFLAKIASIPGALGDGGGTRTSSNVILSSV